MTNLEPAAWVMLWGYALCLWARLRREEARAARRKLIRARVNRVLDECLAWRIGYLFQ